VSHRLGKTLRRPYATLVVASVPKMYLTLSTQRGDTTTTRHNNKETQQQGDTTAVSWPAPVPSTVKPQSLISGCRCVPQQEGPDVVQCYAVLQCRMMPCVCCAVLQYHRRCSAMPAIVTSISCTAAFFTATPSSRLCTAAAAAQGC
jgi:hypothetical protein